MSVLSFKGFPLLYRFNKIVRYINDMGIIHKFMNDFEFNVTILQPIRDRESHESEFEFYLNSLEPIKFITGRFNRLSVTKLANVVFIS